MTTEEEKYYNNYFDLFGTDGWKQLVAELQERLASYDIGYLKDEKDLYKVQGELSILRMLITLEDLIEQGYKNATTTTEPN